MNTSPHTVCVCVCVEVFLACKLFIMGEYSQAGEKGGDWWGGYNELACLRGCAASLRCRAQEPGKANTELISETSKGSRFLPGGTTGKK